VNASADAAAIPSRGSCGRSFHVAVVGGGISGLSTAWYVEREAEARGLPVTCSVLESTDRWGGRILTERVEREEGCFIVEGGPDSFLTAGKPWAVELALELGLGDRLLGTNDVARKVFVWSRGKPVPLPDGVFLLVPTKLKPFVLSPLISPLGKLRMGLDLLIPPRKDPGDETLADFVTRRLGREALDKIAEPLLSGIYNAEADRQSLLATFPRFRETELLHGGLLRGMLANRSQSRSGTARSDAETRTRRAPERPATMFASFLAGTEEITNELARRLSGRASAGLEVRQLRWEAGRGYVLDIAEDRTGQLLPEQVCADAVVLAVPSYEAARLLASVSPGASLLLRAIRYVSTGTISLAYRHEDVASRLNGFGLLIPRSAKRPVNAVTVSSTKFNQRAPAGCSLVRVFFGGSRSPGSMLLDDDELLRVVQRELSDMLRIAAKPLFHRIYRWEAANPQYDVGHLARVEAIERALPAGVWVTGSAYRGVGLPDCVKQAQVTAKSVVNQLANTRQSPETDSTVYERSLLQGAAL